jgi:hypothetical protein
VKKSILISFILFSFYQCYSQQDSIITYFDLDWEECEEPKADYIRKSLETDTGCLTWDYYYPQGTLQMSGSYKNEDITIREGMFCFYRENNILDKKGRYTNNHLNGYWEYYHPNGNIYGKGNYVDDSLDGVWEYFFDSGEISAREEYNLGKLVKMQFWNKDGSEALDIKEPVTQPQFPGGETSMRRFLTENLEYPIEARENGIEGRVIVHFNLNERSAIDLNSIRVSKKARKLFREEGIRIIALMPKWDKGLQHNQPIKKFYYTLPITFQLR